MELLVIFVCILLNGLVACFEMAFVSGSKAELRRGSAQGDKESQLVLSLREHPERTLSIIQILLTLVSALSAAVGGSGAKKMLAPYFQLQLGLGDKWAEIFSILSVVLVLSYF